MPTVQVKASAVLTPATYELDHLVAVVQQACDAFNYTFVITSGRDSHGPADPHTRGHAIDVRAQGLTDTFLIHLLGFFKGAAGPHYYVQYETPTPVERDTPLGLFAVVNPGASAPHIHVQLAKGLDRDPHAALPSAPPGQAV